MDEIPAILRQQQLVSYICRELSTLMPVEFSVVRLNIIALGRSIKLKALAENSTGEHNGLRLGKADVFDPLEELKRVMYQPGAGTWVSAQISVTDEGKISANFNRSEEPEWMDGLVPVPGFFAHELEKFPRDPENIPDWFQKGLDGTLRP